MQTFTQTWLDVLAVDDFEKITNVLDPVSVAIQPQYAHAERIRALCTIFHDETDATEYLEKIAEISSLDSAYGTFLDWLGERIGASRTVTYNGNAVELDDVLYRTLLRWKLVQNIASSDSQTINTLIEKLTGTKIPVKDTGAMTITLDVVDAVSAENLVLLRHYAPEIRPAGVELIFTADYDSMLGFNGQNLSTFNFGVFNPNAI